MIERVAVVGAGMVGLSTAWFLQRSHVETVVLDEGKVASGSSRGNAGWLTPGLATPLPETGVLQYGLRALLRPSSPVYVPMSANPRMWSFLLRFARNCTASRWERGMSALIELNAHALAAFDEIEAPDFGLATRPAVPLLAAYRDLRAQDSLLEEFRHIEKLGAAVEHELLTGDEARDLAPALSDEIVSAVRIGGQRFLDPAGFVSGLAEVVRRCGGQVRTHAKVTSIRESGRGVEIDGEPFDAVVISSGARLGRLARPFGVRQIVQAGRGYSFNVPVGRVPSGPVYFAEERLACTPMGDRLRIAGMMEFRPVDAPLDRRRVEAIKNAAAPLLRDVDLEDRRDEWVGSRPCTADGLPLIGRTTSDRVFVAGGHGMWGMTLGPVTGKLLAQTVVTGVAPDVLRPFDPLR